MDKQARLLISIFHAGNGILVYIEIHTLHT